MPSRDLLAAPAEWEMTMKIMNDAQSWGWPARVLHWAMAVLIIGLLVVGAYMTRLDDIFARFEMTQTHKSFGFVVFVLALARVVWRRMNPVTPAEPGDAKGWEKRAARISHGAFYALMFVMPLSGWLMASASDLQEMYGVRNMVFGLFELPDPFVPGDRTLENVFKRIHNLGAIALALLLAVHVGAALKHHFVMRDDVLRRMTTAK